MHVALEGWVSLSSSVFLVLNYFLNLSEYPGGWAREVRSYYSLFNIHCSLNLHRSTRLGSFEMNTDTLKYEGRS